MVAGEEFEVERLGPGDYRLIRRSPPRNRGLVDLLLRCPEKGYFVPVSRNRPTLCELPRRCKRPLGGDEARAAGRRRELAERHEPQLTMNGIVLGEIRFGILLLPAGKRRDRLQFWFEEVVARIHCLPWEAATGLRWAELLADLPAKRPCRSKTASSPRRRSSTTSWSFPATGEI